ncbi:MAG: hypothetical protein JO073_05755 [Actinobacteria bacterium]|nr:hypothetical protein [Actinomycetota bacterium]
MARARKQPEVKVSRAKVVGVYKPSKPLADDEHHLGFDRALANALREIGRPRGRYQVSVEFAAVVDVVNPGHIIEYQCMI